MFARRLLLRAPAPRLRCEAVRCSLLGAARSCASSAPPRPQKSAVLRPRDDAGGEAKPVRYGPTEVNLKPRDQLRPLLPTWNPPPTRPPQVGELKQSTRLRCKFEDRWWAATVRSMEEDGRVRVGYDGWPSRHDEVVEPTSDRIYLHESVHPDYEAPPMPQRYSRPVPKDEDGNPLPIAPRAPRPKIFDPEKERLKRALRPPLPYNPEKERLKRVLRGQAASFVDAPEQSFNQRPQQSFQQQSFQQQSVQQQSPRQGSPQQVQAPTLWGSEEQASTRTATKPAANASASLAGPPVPAVPLAPVQPQAAADPVSWLEVLGGHGGQRAFRHTATGEVRVGPPPSGWVELLADGGNRYYWHVERNVTVWERPK